MKLNNECLFDVLLYCGLESIVNILVIFKKFNTEYLWKLLCEREYNDSIKKFHEDNIKEFTEKSHYEKYKFCIKLEKLSGEISNYHFYNPYELYTVTYIKTWVDPKTIIKMTCLINIETLFLQNCNLTYLPKEIAKLTNLKELWLCENKLKTLPTEITNLTKLETLCVCSNFRITIPEEILNIKNLDIIDH